jgi:stage II sporulation protein D
MAISLVTSYSIDTTHLEAPTLVPLPLDTPLRILLKESDEGLPLHFESTDGFLLYTARSTLAARIPDKKLHITYVDGAFCIQGKRYAHTHFFLIPIQGILSFESIPYDGFFALHHRAGKVEVINHVGLEDYLAAVLPYESVPSWPDEVQKALCIAARTFALSKIRSSGRFKNHYDLKSTVLDQVYRGHEKKNALRKIIDQTKGMILTYEGKPIVAMYSAVCGGIIPAQRRSMIFKKAPYLKRTYACTFCKDQPLYRWKVHAPLKDFEKTLKKLFPTLGALKNISISSYDRAGIAQNIVLTGADTEISMKAHDFRMLFPQIRSLRCSCTVQKGILTAQGKGHGHHIGLCQWGAYAMAQQGYTYKEILEFYYPETTLEIGTITL